MNLWENPRVIAEHHEGADPDSEQPHRPRNSFFKLSEKDNCDHEQKDEHDKVREIVKVHFFSAQPFPQV